MICMKLLLHHASYRTNTQEGHHLSVGNNPENDRGDEHRVGGEYLQY